MKTSILLPFFSLCATQLGAASRSADTVILSETGMQNLRIETAVVEESDFEESIFALGRIEVQPGNSASVTSRVAGRIVELKALPGDSVQAGQEVVQVETRQPGFPPPTIMLKAPAGGLVTSLAVRLGDPVEPDKPLLEVTDLSKVYAVAQVPEHLAGKIKPDATAHITVSALPDEKFQGELLRFGTSVNRASGTIDAIFVLPNPGTLLRPGMRAEFSIVLSKRTGVVSVPRLALQGDAANRFVYVKDFELPNGFVRAPVVTGQMNDYAVEIVSGLLPADEVVTRGAYSLAFVGGGSVSLKEALDAAHGHEHAADGSELTEAQKPAAAVESTRSGGDSGHFWMIVSGILLVLLIVSVLPKRGLLRAQ